MTRELTLARPIVAAKDIVDLLQMLTYMRPAGSPAEAEFIKRFVAPIAAPDAFGNYWRVIGKGSPVMWSCHTDTVHKIEGKQSIEYGDGFVTTPIGSCLGADCAAGVWLMSRMIRAGVPGTYVFHREEEIGGMGSEYVAKETPERLDGLKYALAFDRKGTTDIITHQYVGRCASDEFANSLARCLGMGHLPDDGGTFTDTANYADIIPECTNLSVGYGKAHSASEYLDVVYLTELLKRILKADFSALECVRKPGEVDPYDDAAWWTGPAGASPRARSEPILMNSGDTLEDIVYNNPQAVAAFLDACGYDADDLMGYIQEMIP
jgi:hypothetical protein